MNTYQEFCRLRDLHIPGVNAPKHTEADAFFMAAAQLAVPDGYKLVPLEPIPEIIAGAAVASWPTASQADITLARMAAPIPPTAEQHADDVAVDCFAAAMKAKLALARAKGRGGWDDPEQCSVDDLTTMLRNQANGGDPIDAGNFAMMIHQRGGNIAPPAFARADVLGLPNFRTGPIAHVYRAAGAEIRTKCEDEQAFVLDRYLRLAIGHGDEWRTAAEADLKAAYARAEASMAVKS